MGHGNIFVIKPLIRLHNEEATGSRAPGLPAATHLVNNINKNILGGLRQPGSRDTVTQWARHLRTPNAHSHPPPSGGPPRAGPYGRAPGTISVQ